MGSKQNGFTLIELIIVIVILGILAVVAAPRFIDLSDDARTSVFVATGSAFQEGVNQVHLAWLIRGNGAAVLNFLPISDPEVGGALSVNAAGYPADTRGTSLTLNSENDCLDVWRAVLDNSSSDVGSEATAQFDATYNDPGACTYTLKADTTKTITYDSNTGAVTINQ
ncbi:MAG: prepilin-type N-terminal cleavage/methylation domain-containing protein [Aliiglaciecola sp.]